MYRRYRLDIYKKIVQLMEPDVFVVLVLVRLVVWNQLLFFNLK